MSNITLFLMPRSSRWLLLLALSMVTSASVAAVLDATSQLPLSRRSATPPQPNVFVSLDTSGSMAWDFMPEGDAKVNGVTVRLGSGQEFVPAGFPNDIFNYGACVVPGIKNASANGDTLYQKQYRSPEVNRLYYNPDIRYRPWVSNTSAPASMPNAGTVDPLWEPMRTARTSDAMVYGQYAVSPYHINATQSIRTRWCMAYRSASDIPANQDFSPGLVYRLAAGANPQDGVSYTRYDVNGSSDHSPDVKHPNRTDCASTKCSQAEERQNFANWFTYYRNRHLLARAALGLSMVNFIDKIRMGWLTYFNSAGSQTDFLNGSQFVRPMTAARLNQVLTGFYGIYPSGDTPTRQIVQVVGNYFKAGARWQVCSGSGGRQACTFQSYADSENPWLATPGVAGSGFPACMRSVHLLISDGYYNDNVEVGNIDNLPGPDYSGIALNPGSFSPTQYRPISPFNDAHSGTLADAVMDFHVNDLQPAVDNLVTPVDGDLAYWQHLTQFMVGLGVSGTLDASTEAAKQATLRRIQAGTVAWPNPASGDAQKIDDMWHAAINTGGDYYQALDPAGLIDHLGNALGRAAGQQSKEAGVAVASARLVSGNLKFVPKYESSAWSGDLEAYSMDATGTTSVVPVWSASANLPIAAQRKLFTWNGSVAVPFVWEAMGSSNQARVRAGLGSDTEAANLVGYLRGETGHEGAAGMFRSRNGRLLGDFVDSPPVHVRDQVDLRYDTIESGYRAYVNQKKARTNGVVMLGGNAGVMHAFNATTGTEVFGYLPQSGLAQLYQVAAKDYGMPSRPHQFFVNGPVVETDAYITTPRSPTAAVWSNVLVGSMGVGAKGFFALHIPTDSPTVLDARTVMWESAADSDVGHVIGEIAVGKIRGGGWKAFVPNGVDSANGAAVLLVVNLATGVIEKRLTVDASPGTGLLGVSLLRDVNQEVVGAYAGDLKGHLWRFDFEGGSAAEWKVGFGGMPLFQAMMGGSTQSITSAPLSVTRVAGGRMVLFGTGRLLTADDADSTSTQSYYGVLDPTQDGASSATAVSPFARLGDARSVLAPLRISVDPQTGASGTFYEVAGHGVDWSTQKGWYLDLPFSRQRILYPSVLLASDHVLIQTLVPAGLAAPCSTSTGQAYNYLLNALDGQPPATPVFDTDGDGVVTAADMRGAGYLAPPDGRDQWVAQVDATHSGMLCSTTSCMVIKVPGATPSSQALTIRDRTWRRIVNPPLP